MRRAAAIVVFCALISSGAVILAASPSISSMTLNFFTTVVDEQTQIGCTYPPLVSAPYFGGDSTSDPAAVGPTSAYTDAPWTMPFTTLTSVAYKNGADCNSSSRVCLSVALNHNETVLSLDSRGTQDPTTGKSRAVRLDFSQPCLYCAYGPGPANPFGANPVSTPGLLSIFLTTPYTSMAVCTTTDCAESETGTARFWFNDASGNQWRVDWGFVRVLRVSANTWYVLANGCDGSQVATLYRLQNKRGNSASRQGQYLMPFFASAAR